MSKKLYIKIEYNGKENSQKEIMRMIDDALPDGMDISSMDRAVVAEIIQFRAESSDSKKWFRGYLESLKDLSIISDDKYDEYIRMYKDYQKTLG